MKICLQVILCFAFVATVFGQGYGRRKPKPVVKPNVVGPSAIVQKPPYLTIGDAFDPMSSLRGGGMGGMPEEVRKVIGSTISGTAIVGGMGGFPRHGGTLNENGLINGWGEDPNLPVIPEVSMWNDPLNGAAFPEDYSGQELVFDPATNRYVPKLGGSIGHQIAKETHVASKTGGIITGGMPASHNTIKAEHNIAKESNHIARKTMSGFPAEVGPFGAVGGVFNAIGDPVSHDINKQLSGRTGSFGPNSMVDSIGHDIVKSSVQHDVAKSTGIISAGKPIVSHGFSHHAGTVNAGHVGRDHPGVIAHNIGKATLGADAVAGHNIAKASGSPVGVGFINPDRVGAIDQFGLAGDSFISHGMVKANDQHVGLSQLSSFNAGHVGLDSPEVIAHNVGKATLGMDAVAGHNVAKASGNPVGLGFINPTGMFASQIGHDIAKENAGMGLSPVGPVMPSDPVHNVNKVGHSGLASMGHDPLAANLGHGIAKQAVSEAARAVNIGSRGGVVAGDPIALAATHGLAKESLHVAGKTMNMASSGGVGGNVAAGMDIFGQGSMMVHPKPVKKPFPTITGYGRRQRG